MASLISCGACGKPVSSEASACPACGHPVKATIAAATPALSASSKRTLRKIVVVAVLVVAVLGVATYVYRKKMLERGQRYDLVEKLNRGSALAESGRFFSLVDDDAIEISKGACDASVLREYRETSWVMDALEKGNASWFGCADGITKIEPPWR